MTSILDMQMQYLDLIKKLTPEQMEFAEMIMIGKDSILDLRPSSPIGEYGIK